MHDGFKTLYFVNEKWSVVQEYRAHSSLAYGIDWCYDPVKNIIASCSFYDNLVHLWEASGVASQPRG